MQISPPTVRGTYGSFVQIATCLGIIVALLIGTPVKDIDRWSETFCCIASLLNFICVKSICTKDVAFGRWRVCFWVAAIPATLQALAMEFCAESPQWLYKVHLLWATAGSLHLIYQVKHAYVLLLPPILVGLFLLSCSC